MTELNEVRQDFIQYVRRQLVGPFGGVGEIIADPPNRRYLMGILFPRKVVSEPFFEDEGEQLEDETEAVEAKEESLFADNAVQGANDFLPSSVGLSFFTDATSFTVTASSGRYETLSGQAAKEALPKDESSVAQSPEEFDSDGAAPAKGRKSSRVWRRVPLPDELHEVNGTGSTSVWEGRAEINVRWRQLGPAALVTVTLLNSQESTGEQQTAQMWEDMLLQAGLRIDLPEGRRLLEYPAPNLASHDPEEEELRLLYRNQRTYAIGHGCSADWQREDPVSWVRSEVMPTEEVQAVAASGYSDHPVLRLSNLADDGLSESDLVSGLAQFVEGYATWTNAQHSRIPELPERMRPAAKRVLNRVDDALSRMAAGVEVLRDDRRAMRAFRLANRAMLMQMAHAAADLAGSRRPRSDEVNWPTAYQGDASWKPFQLGFFLTAVRGLVHDGHPDRDIVDLIWFPTGGGKTEAYLLLSVFEIFHRRMVHGRQGGGTTVISRYTLSLLTAQQFQRAATTTCAAEIVRREFEAELGSTAHLDRPLGRTGHDTEQA